MNLMIKKSNVMLRLGIALAFLIFIRFFSSFSILVYDPKHHLTLHITLEFFSVFISLFIAVQGWMVYHHTKTNNTLYIGSLFLAIAIFDFMHTLSYKGMPFFITVNTIEKATWFWIVARLTESFGLLFFLSANRYKNLRLNKTRIYGFAILYVTIITALIFLNRENLPQLYIEGMGLTKLKITLEYIISTAHLLTIVVLYARFKIERNFYSFYLIQSLGFLFLSEIIFTLYHNVHDFDNFLGHLYKVIGYYFLFKGIVVSFTKPYKEKMNIEIDKLRIEEHFKLMVESISGAYVAIDHNEKIILANKSTYKLFNEKENLVGQNLRAYYSERGFNDEESRVLKAVKTGKSFHGEKVNLGQKVFLSDAVPLIDSNTGEILGASTYFIDITKQENKIQKQNELLMQHLNNARNVQQILDSLPIGFLAIDNKENILSINNQLFKNKNKNINRDTFIGLPLKEYTQLTISTINYDDLYIIQALKGHHIENSIQHVNGNTYIVSAHPIIDDNTQQILGAIASYHDVTELERIREEMTKMERIEMVGQMAASITHEIRNPLAAVRGFIQLLDEQAVINQKSYFKIILDELDRANEIIKDFLSLSGNREIKKEKRSLNKIIQEISPIFAAEANMRGHELHLMLYDETGHNNLILDEQEIKQLLLNLVRNGYESMNKHGKLTIATKNEQNQVILTITDTGIGIPEDVLNNLFTPFFTTKENGTGLGLAVCKSIVEKHNGSIHVHSILGAGTTFEIRFNNQSQDGFEDTFTLSR